MGLGLHQLRILTSKCDRAKEIAGPEDGLVAVCEMGPDGVGRMTLTLKIEVDNATGPAKTKFLGFLKNGCAGLSLLLSSSHFRVEIEEVYAPKFKQKEMYEDILIYSQGLYSPYYFVSFLVLKHDVPDST